MSIHFDVLYIGNDEKVWSQITMLSEKFQFTCLNAKNFTDMLPIKEEFSFNIILTELHLDYNYEGFMIDKLDLEYFYLGFLTSEIDKEQILVSENLLEAHQKFLLLKKDEIFSYFLVSKPLHTKTSLIPVEA